MYSAMCMAHGAWRWELGAGSWELGAGSWELGAKYKEKKLDTKILEKLCLINILKSHPGS